MAFTVTALEHEAKLHKSRQFTELIVSLANFTRPA